VFVVADDVPKEKQVEETYPSIYHWVLRVGKEVELDPENGTTG
jgi:hypothetical protein